MTRPGWTRLGMVMVGSLAAGCSHTAITGDGSRQSQVIHGSVGITGQDHELTIMPGSDVSKLSVMGEDNRILIREGAAVRKIEIVGEDNQVICPEDLDVEFSTVGEDNRLIRRL